MSTYYKENDGTVVFRIAAPKVTLEDANGEIQVLPLADAPPVPTDVDPLGAPSGTAATDITTLYAKVNELLAALQA